MAAGFRIRDGNFSVRRLLQQEFNGTFPPRPPFGPNSPGPRQGSYFSRSFNSNVVVVMAVLLFALVVAAFINTIARCILRRRRPQASEDHNNVEKGLDKSAIEALPVVAYGAEALKSIVSPAGGNECVVCLSEFTPGEKIRLLPGCQHGFHLSCIDTWLLTHTSCPVCRRSVLPASPHGASDSSLDPGCAQIVGGSARFGSSRFSSARIASVDIEIEGPSSASAVTDPGASSSSRSKRAFASILSAEAMATIIGSRRFGVSRNVDLV